jgi:hypothetical protein
MKSHRQRLFTCYFSSITYSETVKYYKYKCFNLHRLHLINTGLRNRRFVYPRGRTEAYLSMVNGKSLICKKQTVLLYQTYLLYFAQFF